VFCLMNFMYHLVRNYWKSLCYQNTYESKKTVSVRIMELDVADMLALALNIERSCGWPWSWSCSLSERFHYFRIWGGGGLSTVFNQLCGAVPTS
jgi:hypothetical protein